MVLATTAEGVRAIDTLQIGVTVSGDREPRIASHEPGRILGGALENLGANVSYLERRADAWSSPTALDVVVAVDPDFPLWRAGTDVVSVAIVAGRTGRWLAQPWFNDFDLVLTTTARSAEIVSHRSAQVARVLEPEPPQGSSSWAAQLLDGLASWRAADEVAISTAVESRYRSAWWGDYHYARDLQRWIRRAGHPSTVLLANEGMTKRRRRAALTIHLVGLTHAELSDHVNFLWVISHPEIVDKELCSRFDRVYVASTIFAEALSQKVSVPVVPLSQATDPERFRPSAGGPHHDVLFVGSSRGVRRSIVDDMETTGIPFDVYGEDWTPDLLNPDRLRGELVPNLELPRYYANATVVLNDHWPAMREHGFMSNRLYDALGTGALVITDPVPGMDSEFDDGVVEYRDAADLKEKVRFYLEDEGARTQVTKRGRTAVLHRHTFEHRVECLLHDYRALGGCGDAPPGGG